MDHESDRGTERRSRWRDRRDRGGGERKVDSGGRRSGGGGDAHVPVNPRDDEEEGHAADQPAPGSSYDAFLRNLGLLRDSSSRKYYALVDSEVVEEDWQNATEVDFGDVHTVMIPVAGSTFGMDLEADISEDTKLLGDSRGISSTSGDGTRHHRRVLQYAEDVSTGKFIRHRGAGGGEDRASRFRKKEARSMNVDSQDAFVQWMSQTICFLRSLWSLIQGLLAGFSASTLYIVAASNSDQELVENYAPLANETRRLLYMLCTMSFIGAVDTYFHCRFPLKSSSKSDKAKALKLTTVTWKKRPRKERIVYMAIIGLYALVLAMTTVCAVGDSYLHRLRDQPVEATEASETDGDGALETWVQVAFEDETFRDTLELWKVANLVRFCGAALAWILVCRAAQLDGVRTNHTDAVLEISRRLDHFKERYHRFSGHMDTLSAMSIEELRRLLRQQEMALKFTEKSIEIVSQRVLAQNPEGQSLSSTVLQGTLPRTNPELSPVKGAF